MSELIDLNEFLEENFDGLPQEKELIKLPSPQIPGVVIENEKIFLSQYDPEIDWFYHQGSFMGFDPEFDNLENIRNGFFGNPSSYTYISKDRRVKPSRPLMDVYLKIDYKRLNQKVYRDPETFTAKYSYEWDRSFIIDGNIPKSAIMEVSFPKEMRLIHELRRNGNTLLDLDEYFQRIKQLRRDFKALF